MAVLLVFGLVPGPDMLFGLAPLWGNNLLLHGALYAYVDGRCDIDVAANGALLEVGDRTPGDEATYPDDDIRAECVRDNLYRFTRKDGTPY